MLLSYLSGMWLVPGLDSLLRDCTLPFNDAAIDRFLFVQVAIESIHNRHEILKFGERLKTSVADPGRLFGSRIRIFSIPDPGSASKNLSILTQKIVFLSSRKYDPGCSSRIRILIFYPSRIPGSKRRRIPDLHTAETFSSQENKGIKRKAEGGSPPPAKQAALSASGRREAGASQAPKRPSKVSATSPSL
jgi:hypothetical protein